MTSKDRMSVAMWLGTPDRVPVMCQLTLGHYFLNAGIDPLEIWFSSEGFAEALVRLQRRYRFDGILVNLPGRPPDWRKFATRIDCGDSGCTVQWRNGGYSTVPLDDNVHYFRPDGARPLPRFEDIDPDQLYYVEPWDITEVSYPYTWAFADQPAGFDDFFPSYHHETIRAVIARTGHQVSVHAEVFSPFSQLLELLGCEAGLLALVEDPAKVRACLQRLTAGATDLACRHASASVDAVLISSAFAGAGFISRDMYEQFVSPYERQLIEGVKTRHDLPIYTHTCGAIGDRLDLMLETGTDGIDTLDPPPLGTVELAQAKQQLAGQAFIKGNIDPVNTLLKGDLEAVEQDVRRRLAIAAPGGGYILSSACSVPPRVEPAKLEALVPLAEECGRYT